VQIKDFRSYVIEYVKEFNPTATPAYLRGGIGCATSNGFAADIDNILTIAGNVSYFAIEIGTYDAWGGSAENVGKFTDNLRRIITACQAKGIEPVIARIPATDSGKVAWQIPEAYLKVIDELTEKHHLIPGPDLYTWFLQHPDELNDDGIMPSARGGASIQRLWAEAVYKLYDPSTPARKKPVVARTKKVVTRKKKQK
jgi:lysophospholipase L1-like esterase